MRNQADEGLILMLLGTILGSPFLFYFGFFQFITASMVAPGVAVAAAAPTAVTGLAAGGVLLSAATLLGFGALIIYGAVGLGYLYSAVKEAYSSEKNIGDLFKSRVVPQEGWSFINTMKSIASVLWSPFILIGGLTGLGLKALVKACCGSQSSLKDSGITTTTSNSSSKIQTTLNHAKPQSCVHAASREMLEIAPSKKGKNFFHSGTNLQHPAALNKHSRRYSI